MYFLLLCAVAAVVAVFIKGIHIIRPMELGLVEAFGRYRRIVGPGFRWIMPLFRKLYTVTVAERVLDIEPQRIITSDSASAFAGALIYFRVRPDADGVRAALYNADDCLAQTKEIAEAALKDIMGQLPLRQLGAERARVAGELRRLVASVASGWGLEITRAELKEIEFQKDVQDSLNRVLKAENEKKAAADLALAAEKAAEGVRRAEIKKAEGQKQARILAAEGEARAISTICEAARQYFDGSTQLLRVLEASETALRNIAGGAPGSPELRKVLGALHDGANGHGPHAPEQTRDR